MLLDSAAFKNIFTIWYQSQITMIESKDHNQKKKQKNIPHKCSIQSKQLEDTWWHFTSLDFFLCFHNTSIRALTIHILPMTIITFLVLNFKYLKLIHYFLHVYFIFLELECEFFAGRISPRFNSSSTPFSTDYVVISVITD